MNIRVKYVYGARNESPLSMSGFAFVTPCTLICGPPEKRRLKSFLIHSIASDAAAANVTFNLLVYSEPKNVRKSSVASSFVH